MFTFLDSILLNCCISDIERFCEKLKTDPKTPPNNKIHGDVSAYDNALSRKDQYKATDFVSVFQKFKLAFNLLVCKNTVKFCVVKSIFIDFNLDRYIHIFVYQCKTLIGPVRWIH